MEMLALADEKGEVHNELLYAINTMKEAQWKKAYAWVNASGLGGYFFKKSTWLEERTDCRIPVRLMNQCKQAYHTCLYEGMLYRSFYSMFSKKMDDAGIEYIPIKGIDLIESIYSDIGTRSLGDIDILVRRSDIAAVDKVLRESGFSGDGEARKVQYMRYHYHLCYACSYHGHNIHLELHWNIMNRYPEKLVEARLWEDGSLPKGNRNSRERRLGLAYHFIILVLHASKHRYSLSLKWLMDLFLLARKENLLPEINGILRIIEENSLRKAALFVTLLVRNMFEKSSALDGKDFFSLLAGSIKLPPETRSVINHLATPEVFLDRAAFLRGKWPSYLFNMLMQDNLKDAFAFARGETLSKLYQEGLIR